MLLFRDQRLDPGPEVVIDQPGLGVALPHVTDHRPRHFAIPDEWIAAATGSTATAPYLPAGRSALWDSAALG
jgi:hypothetical protein